MRQDRQATEVRPIHIIPNYMAHAEGSAWLEWGNNKVLATVTIENTLPPHLRGKKGHRGGWLNAEYALIPRSTEERVRRERLYAGGRTQEIQRLMGRALRSVVDLSLFHNKTITIDADIIQADGGTRCASIVAGYAALFNAADKLINAGVIDEWPLKYELAAVSVGMVEGQQLVDLEYSEDMIADMDINVVGTGDGKIIEVQGGSEGEAVDAEVYVQLVAKGITGIGSIVESVRNSMAENTVENTVENTAEEVEETVQAETQDIPS